MGKFLLLMDSFRKEARHSPLSRLVKHIAKQSGLERHLTQGTEDERVRWENVRELVSAASHYDSLDPQDAVVRFLDSAALASREDEKEKGDAVRLATIHSAKGLEFTAVFVVGMEDNVFPHSRSKRAPEELEEERRLCYVAVTRAKEHLWLMFAQARRLFGQLQANPPSRFLFDIPERLIAFTPTDGAEHVIDIDEPRVLS